MQKAYLANRVFQFLVYLILFGRPAVAEPYHFQAYFDSHVHVFYSEDNKMAAEHFASFFSNEAKKVKKALIISPSYVIDSRFEQAGNEYPYRELRNKLTADLVAQDVSRFFGVCGMNHFWSDAVEVTSKCLKLPGMIGIKLRFSDGDRLVDKNHFERIRLTLKENSKKAKVLLIHMPGEYPWAYYKKAIATSEEIKSARVMDNEDLDKLLALAKQFPLTQFVVAHSLNSFHLVEDLAAKSKGVNNIWIEVSTSLTTLLSDWSPYELSSPSWENYAKAWRKFNIDKILFGSDQLVGEARYNLHEYDGGEMFDQQSETIVRNPFLSEDEKNKILHENGRNFIEVIGQ